jgi:hypothetical protein
MLVARTPQPASLTYWCAPVEGAAVPAEVITWVLRGIACADVDVESAEAWVAPSGQFRLGPARGAWAKPMPEYIGRLAWEIRFGRGWRFTSNFNDKRLPRCGLEI